MSKHDVQRCCCGCSSRGFSGVSRRGFLAAGALAAALPATSWRVTGAIQDKAELHAEEEHIRADLKAMQASAEFALEVLPLVTVRTVEEAKRVAKSDFDVQVIYAARRDLPVLEALADNDKWNAITINACRSTVMPISGTTASRFAFFPICRTQPDLAIKDNGDRFQDESFSAVGQIPQSVRFPEFRS